MSGARELRSLAMEVTRRGCESDADAAGDIVLLMDEIESLRAQLVQEARRHRAASRAPRATRSARSVDAA